MNKEELLEAISKKVFRYYNEDCCEVSLINDKTIRVSFKPPAKRKILLKQVLNATVGEKVTMLSSNNKIDVFKIEDKGEHHEY